MTGGVVAVLRVASQLGSHAVEARLRRTVDAMRAAFDHYDEMFAAQDVWAWLAVRRAEQDVLLDKLLWYRTRRP